MKKKFIFLLVSFFIWDVLVAQDNTVNITPSNVIEIAPNDTPEIIRAKAASVLPSAIQMAYLQREYIAFIHFGVNTFNRVEWGSGFENPEVFAPTHVDTDQWCRILKSAGMTTVVLTAKHHDGFCLWQTRYTKHSVASSLKYENGKGDVLKDLSKSCQKYGLKLGVYLSPVDLYQIENRDGLYGNLSESTIRTIPRYVEGRPFKDQRTFQFEVDDYNEYFLNQLFELLTEYGPIYEVWFDGAHPKTKGGQQYVYSAWYQLIRELAPNAVIFGKGPDVRWCGNEAGVTRQSEWNVVPLPLHPDQCDWPDLRADDIGSMDKLLDAKYLYYLPAETNTSIRRGWFYRDDTFQRVRSATDIVDIYERAVGGNSVFMLNVPPNREGRISLRDEDALRESGRRLKKIYSNNLIETSLFFSDLIDGDLTTYTGKNEIIIPIQKGKKVNRLVVQEATPIKGQRVECFSLYVEKQAKERGYTRTKILTGTTIGYKKIIRFDEQKGERFILRINSSRLKPAIAEVGLYYAPSYPPRLKIKRNKKGVVSIKPILTGFEEQKLEELINLEDLKIVYTLDGSDPSLSNGKPYKNPFVLSTGGRLKAIAILDQQPGVIEEKLYGLSASQVQWRLFDSSKSQLGSFLFALQDENSKTTWFTKKTFPSKLSADLGKIRNLTGFSWLPPQNSQSNGKFELGHLEVSTDKKNWKQIVEFKFGNTINDSSLRVFMLEDSVLARFARIVFDKGAGESQFAGASEIQFFVE